MAPREKAGDGDLEGLRRRVAELESGRRQAERDLRLTQFCFDRASVAIFRIAADARILAVNDQACEYLGYTRDELCALSIFDINPKVDATVWGQLWERMRELGTNRFESRHRRKDGAIVPVEITANHLEFQGDEFAIAFVVDISEQRRVAEEREALIEELEAKNAELERFAYTVSHDLKSPLLTISGFLQLIERDGKAGNLTAVDAHLKRVLSAAGTMNRRLDEVLSLSRIGRVVSPSEEMGFGSVAEEAVESMSPRIDEAGVQVVVEPDMPVVFGDRSRLLEVLQNLLENALKFMGEQAEPRIEIGRRRGQGRPVLYVRDNGIGIEPRYHRTVFELFQQVDARSPGSGAGLAIVRRIVEVHGGRIWVESPGLGQGSTFCFTLGDRPEAVSPSAPE